MATSRTSSSTPKLSELAKHYVAPAGVVSSGWPAVERKAADLGISFRPWQVPVGRLILAKRADGLYASTIGGTGLSIPRQVGKTFLVGAIVFALCLLRPKLTVIWTAHRLRTAEETFAKMQAMAKRRKIAPYVLKTVTGSGEGSIVFRNGSRILFGARERGFGRGFDEVDVLVFDEAQILTENALDDMVPAANQSRQDTSALQLYMGTPPKPKDPSEVFTRMRREALSGTDSDTGWVEFGADDDFTPTLPPDPLNRTDWAQISKANPSYPSDTSQEAILRMRKKLGADSFLREGLGIWDEDVPDGVFDMTLWGSLRDEKSKIPGAVMLGVEVAEDRSWSAVAAGGINQADKRHLEVVEYRPDVRWVVDRVTKLSRDHSAAVVIRPSSPAGSLIADLEDNGVTVHKLSQQEYAQACGDVFDAVKNREVAHIGQGELDASIRGAKTKPSGDAFVFDIRKSGLDISPLTAVTIAAWGRKAFDTGPSVYEERGLIIL